MKRFSRIYIILFFLICISACCGYAQVAPATQGAVVKAVDVNEDGKPDVSYYSQDNKYISKVEADTNYDGKPDVVVHLKDGKFDSAEVDTNYDGKTDKKFSDVNDFNKWLNENNPNFSGHLNRGDWQLDDSMINYSPNNSPDRML